MKLVQVLGLLIALCLPLLACTTAQPPAVHSISVYGALEQDSSGGPHIVGLDGGDCVGWTTAATTTLHGGMTANLAGVIGDNLIVPLVGDYEINFWITVAGDVKFGDILYFALFYGSPPVETTIASGAMIDSVVGFVSLTLGGIVTGVSRGDTFDVRACLDADARGERSLWIRYARFVVVRKGAR